MGHGNDDTVIIGAWYRFPRSLSSMPNSSTNVQHTRSLTNGENSCRRRMLTVRNRIRWLVGWSVGWSPRFEDRDSKLRRRNRGEPSERRREGRERERESVDTYSKDGQAGR